MERHELIRLLAGDDAVSKAALAALVDGGEYVIWEETELSSEARARAYESRGRSYQRRGVETLGLERGVQLLREHAQPIHAGKITAVDGSWIFHFFLTEDRSDLVACIGGRRPERHPRQ
ncbi:hypothetical protein ABT237_14890 [Streptomyces sp. NPDC001581]|uniref:hypothetical protein n=1 Tax=Streptomyces sp. NPDC001581 TaxID=3154386 RepID=UPI003324D301